MVIAKIDDDVDSTEIYSSDDESDEANVAQLCNESESIDNPEYYSDGQMDKEESVGDYAPPTPPKPREEAGAFRVILDHDVDLDLTEYFTESKDKQEDDPKQPREYKQPISPSPKTSPKVKIFYSDCKEDTHETDDYDTSNGDFNGSSTFNLISKSAYEGDISTYAMNTSLDTKRRKKLKKHKLAPILRMSYYGQKRLMIRKRNFVLSVMEYFAGASLGSSARKIPFYYPLVSP